MKIFESVVEILKGLSGAEEIQVKDSLQNDLALDSLSMVALLIEIEEFFEIELDEADMNPFDLKTVEDIVVLVEKYCNEKKS